MVGFGSSLRMARRAGWEEAYLDYETLKLLLSQIESVYEEHRNQKNDEENPKRRDFRDELFLESDSDEAFASDIEEEGSDGIRNPKIENRASRFTMMGSFSSEESASIDDDGGRCGGAPWRTETKNVWKGNRLTKRYLDSSEDFYIPPNRDADVKSFFVQEEGGSIDLKPSSSLFNAPFQYESNSEEPNEETGLLRFQENYFSGGGLQTPPRQNLEGMPTGLQILQSPDRGVNKKKQNDNHTDRLKARQKRRMTRRQRRKRDKKVPPHLRAAHAKARAITERFLGLLRAEVEKVTLFAQARLGELADTAGSLRFMSSSEGLSRPNGGLTKAYDHPLSDGGIHPSASSSSEEGRGGQGLWLGDSSDEEQSQESHYSQSFLKNSASKQNAVVEDMGIARARSQEEHELLQATKQKIEHVQQMLRERPIFQRNDHIVGEDMLLLSAVDEADGYTAVGVELLHLLKFICVNVIAVRKVCRKHDRLLGNRMLGGFYHRKRKTRAQEEGTLGGLVAHVAGDVYEVHPALIGLVNHGKLCGVYDLKIQQLANSCTVKVISSSLALALSEYEVSRTRADALATLTEAKNQNILDKNVEQSPSRLISFDFRKTSDWVRSPPNTDEGDSDFSDEESIPLSTSSSVSLVRLQFTVLSISALREASRMKSNNFETYLSRNNLSFTGQAVIGDGLDGCSRDTLDFLVDYTPDAALLLDYSTLHKGLRQGRWRNNSIANVMQSSLAVGMDSTKSLQEKENMISNALGILPKSEGIDSSVPFEGRRLPLAMSFSITRFAAVPPGLLRANRYSLLLYTMNYYIAHPTLVTFTDAIGANVALSASIIGAASLAALFAAVVHRWALQGLNNSKHGLPNVLPYKRLLLASAACAITGNLIQAYGIIRLSLPLAVIGRFFIGLGASEIVHRQLILSFLQPSLIVPESARLMQFRVIGLMAGLFLGSLIELVPIHSSRLGVRSIQILNWVMATFWFTHFCHLGCSRSTLKARRSKIPKRSESWSVLESAENNDGSDSSDSNPGGTVGMFHQPPSIRRGNDSVDRIALSLQPKNREILRTRTDQRQARKQPMMTVMRRVRKLMSHNVAVPLSLALTVYTIFAQEVLFSSCALITDRYFSWHGSIAGFFLGSLAISILPVDFICELIARRYEERTTIRRSLFMLTIGLLVMINWGSVFAMVANIKILFTETLDERHHYYDWLLGIPQYVIGLILTYIGLKALDSASRALLSKVSPPKMQYSSINVATIMSFLGPLAQFVANFQIVAGSLSHRIINTDIVNLLVMPLLVGCIIAYFFVQKHYFFMM